MAKFRKQKKYRLAFEINEDNIKFIDEKLTEMFDDIEEHNQFIHKKYILYSGDGTIIELDGIDEISKHTMQRKIVRISIIFKKTENGIKINLGREVTEDETNLYYYIISNEWKWFNVVSDKIERLLKSLELGYSVFYSKRGRIIQKILSFIFIIGLSIFAGFKFIVDTNMTDIFMITATLLSTSILSYLILLTFKTFGFLFPDTVLKFDRDQRRKQFVLTGLRAWIIHGLIGGIVLGVLTSLLVSLII